jgi:hypothetical protein
MSHGSSQPSVKKCILGASAEIRTPTRLLSGDYVAYKTTVLPLHYTGELADGVGFEPTAGHKALLVNSQIPATARVPIKKPGASGANRTPVVFVKSEVPGQRE